MAPGRTVSQEVPDWLLRITEAKTVNRRRRPWRGYQPQSILPLLQGEAAGRLRATTIIEWLEEKSPGRFSASQLRTLQRRLQRTQRSGSGGLLPPRALAGRRNSTSPTGNHTCCSKPFRVATPRWLPASVALKQGLQERALGTGRRAPGHTLRQQLGPHP